VGYSSYCDCVRVVPSASASGPIHIVTRGVELIQNPFDEGSADDAPGSTPFLSKPNSIGVFDLTLPTKNGGRFVMKEVKHLQHIEYAKLNLQKKKKKNKNMISLNSYHANSWLVKIATNGQYTAAPTVNGKVFIFDMNDGKAVQVLADHEDREVRDVIFHPFKKQLISCGDGIVVCVEKYCRFTLSPN